MDKFIRVLAVVSVTLLIGLGSFATVERARTLDRGGISLSEVLFGASSIALTLVAILIGVAALFGWQVVEKSQVRIAQEIANEMRVSMEKENRGRILSALGYFVGESNRDPESIGAKDRSRMQEAVELCQQGYNYLQPIGGAGMYMALNNLIYYLCVYDDSSRRLFILENADKLMSAGQEKGALDLQLTACRAILQYEDNPRKKAIAYNLLGELSLNETTPGPQRQEAKLYLSKFPRPAIVPETALVTEMVPRKRKAWLPRLLQPLRSLIDFGKSPKDPE